MKKYTSKHERKNSIPNKTYSGHVCSNNASCCIVGKDLYGIKAQNDGYVVLYKITNYVNTNASITYYPIKYSNGKYLQCHHANSITNTAGTGFIIATMNDTDKPAAIKISKTGVVKKEIYHISSSGENKSLSCITFVRQVNGKNQFIVGDGRCNNSDDSFSPKYKLATLYSNKLIDEPYTYYTNIHLSNDLTANDITYDENAKAFYNVYFKKNSKNQIATNYVHKFPISNLEITQELIAQKQWTCKKTSKETKFEIEAFFLGGDKGSTKYCITNTEGDGIDGLYKLVNE